MAAVDEAISVLRAMWEPQKRTSFSGEIFTVETDAGPTPDHRIEIWLGGIGPRMMNVLGRRADGWISPIMSPFEDKRPAQNAIDQAAVAAGRSPQDVRRVIQLTGEVVPGSSKSGGVRPAVTGPNQAPIVAPADVWARLIDDLVANERYDTVNFIPRRQTSEQLQRFGAEVVPLVSFPRTPTESSSDERATQ